jgi:hypothetical protein
MRHHTRNSRGKKDRPKTQESGAEKMSTEADSLQAVRLMLAYLCAATEKEASLERKVEILDKFKLTDKEISTICGGALQSIRNARHSIRKHGRKTKRSR